MNNPAKDPEQLKRETEAYLARIRRTISESEALVAKTQLLIALDEVVSNVVRCSGATGIAIEMRFSQAPKGVTVVLSDDGKPFNPLHVPTPDTKGSADERPVGGLGILLLRKTMDSLAYRYAHGCNILTFQKRLDAV